MRGFGPLGIQVKYAMGALRLSNGQAPGFPELREYHFDRLLAARVPTIFLDQLVLLGHKLMGFWPPSEQTGYCG